VKCLPSTLVDGGRRWQTVDSRRLSTLHKMSWLTGVWKESFDKIGDPTTPISKFQKSYRTVVGRNALGARRAGRTIVARDTWPRALGCASGAIGQALGFSLIRVDLTAEEAAIRTELISKAADKSSQSIGIGAISEIEGGCQPCQPPATTLISKNEREIKPKSTV